MSAFSIDRAAPFDHSPLHYVWHLAGYIKDPSKIRAHTVNQFGRAPTMDRIDYAIRERRRMANIDMTERNLGQAHVAEDDGRPFRVAGIPQPEPEPELTAPMIVTVANEQGERMVEIVTVRDIISAIARDFGFTFDDLTGKDRHRPVVLARRTAAYVLHKRGSSYPQVGRWLGVDHSSVIHAVRQFEARATPEMWAVAERYILREQAA